ncbi:MAG: alpha,alpha-trehalose-phosphate synthase (UDP-forming), partial [Candidatus Binataceae bacterium]
EHNLGKSDVPTRRGLESGGRLVVMSNRAPIRVVRVEGREEIEPTVGGVGTTFLRLLERNGGVWIAWPGGRRTPQRLWLPKDNPRFVLVSVPLSERDVSDYYYGMCNRGLWPLMHLMTPNCHFNAEHWSNYQAVNDRFAARATAELRAGDALWVQDFHLALTPRMVRERDTGVPIGLFWHVPFPPEPVFRVIPWRREILSGMLGSDLIGFHTPLYVMHFLNCCEKILGVGVNRERSEVIANGHVVKVGAFPLGIPVDFFESLARSKSVKERAMRIRRGMRTPHVVLGVDRLDYTKGILERLLGFERFLEQNPEYHRKVTLVLVAVPSRTRVADYAQLKRELDENVGRVVGRFSSAGWVPIRYNYTQFGAHELVSYYLASDVALLTPLRDGMNLVAKEYVASHPDDDGVLILSEFAGAAEELKESLLVNPYDIDEIAARLKEAIEMPPRERARRMQALRERVRVNNLERWSENFLSALHNQHRGEPFAEPRVASR